MIELALALLLYVAPPTLRENGSELYSNEIDYYELYLNGAPYLTTAPTSEDGSAEFDVLEDGDYQVRVFDVEGLVSELSEPLSINNAIRARPNPPGLSRRKSN